MTSTAAPNVLLIVSDDQRPDTIRALGNPAIETPHLDRLVARGTSFSRAYAGYPICHVSRAQILTGTHAFRALPDYPAGAIDADLATMGATFSQAGWHTCYSGKWHNDGHPLERGYAVTSGLFSSGGAKGFTQPGVDERGRPLTGYRGWTFKDADNRPQLDRGIGLQPDNSREVVDGAIRAIESGPKDRPWFAHVNFAFPHDPRLWPAGMENYYDPAAIPLPPNFAASHPFEHGNLTGRDERLLPAPRTGAAVREELALYYAMITDLDREVGRLLDALPALGETIVIFTSDQGLALGSHGLIGKQNCYEHSIRSPLLIAGPGLPQGKQSGALVNLQDLFPTLCDLAAITVPATVTGRSLAPLLRGETEKVHDYVVGMFTDTQRMICDDRWKYVTYPQAGREQLFDLVNDPHEQHDLGRSPERAGVRNRLKEQLDRWRRENGDPLEP